MSSNKVTQMRAESDVAFRRRLRKGTKSCLPCRSRKIRCTYPTNSGTCNACITHGRECVEQTYQDVKNGGLDKRVGLKQRVRELETLVQQLVGKGGADAKALEHTVRAGQGTFLSPPDSTTALSNDNDSPQGTEPSMEGDSSDAYDSLDDVDATGTANTDFQKAPLMALFDNNLLLRDDSKDARESLNLAQRGPSNVSRHGPSSKARQAKVAQELRNLFPSWVAIKAMLDHGKELLTLWQELVGEHSKFLGIGNIEESLRQMSQNDQPVELCKGLLFLALIIQQTPEDASLQNPAILSGKHQAHLIQKYLETVEGLLCSANTMIGTLDGLECAVLLCRILFNAGRPRKAWLLYQRALSFARLLGFHRAPSWKTEPDPSIGVRREQLWWHLFVGDRALSLLLGLPYSIMDEHLGIDPSAFNGPVESGASTGRAFIVNTLFMHLGIVTGRIIDRNHSPSTSPASIFAETMKIDGELHALEVTMPKKWLALGEEAGDLSEFMDMSVKEIFEASNTQIWHHECRIALHMPYMMMNAPGGQAAGQYEYSRTIALKSARSLIRSHLRLRTRPELSNIVCQVVDFQVFMATVLLILDLLSRRTGVPRLLERGDAESIKDEQLAKGAYEMLQRLAQENTYKTNIPAQSIKVLETLAYLIHGKAVPGAERTNRRIMIPYFGAITIKASSTLVESRKKFQARMGESCLYPADASNPEETQVDANEPHSIPTPRSFTSLEVNQPSSNANGFTFNSFVAPQKPASLAQYSDTFGAFMPTTIQQGYNTPSLSSPSSQPGMEVDTQMWDESMWQNMLTQDLSLDLDVDWGYLPVEGGM